MTIDVKDAGGVTRTIEVPNANGRAGAASSRPVVLSTEDLAAVSQPASGRAAAAASKPVTLSTEDKAALDAILTGPLDTVIKASTTSRSLIVGFTGAQITTTSGSAAITITTAPTAGTIKIGQIVTATGIPAGTTIASGSSTSWTLSANATASGTAVVMTSGGPDQLMAANAARRGVAYQNQGSGDFYVNGVGSATTDHNSLKLPSQSYFETPAHHVGTGAISVMSTVPAAGLYAREF